ncbi:hypothetical protein QVD17_09863 [Tagetes erecta]|uniref:Uncharacterized protein n=1 Tax=Tagetes erecta TaxID=13708 RepID=A0AAD8NYZ8_TARER|nr:hypothetical protein QVD17_09863 [Tagetes erecta]
MSHTVTINPIPPIILQNKKKTVKLAYATVSSSSLYKPTSYLSFDSTAKISRSSFRVYLTVLAFKFICWYLWF